MIRLSERLRGLPPYLFAELNRRADEIRARGVDVIDLAAGDPDLPPLPHVLDALERALCDPAQHRYPPYAGTDELRSAAARYYRRRFGVELDPDHEVLVLIGAKEGLAHAARAVLDPEDVALVPDPGYPVYANQALLCGGTVRRVPAGPATRYLADLGAVDPAGAKVLFLNYPSNPTGAICDLSHLAAAVAFCRRHGLLLVHDLAYGEITYDGHVAPSVLQVPGAREVAVEITSLSKTYRMAGMRVGFAAGNREAVRAIRILKSHADTGQFRAIWSAAVAALDGPQDHLERDRRLYERRRDRVVAGLMAAGLEPHVPGGALYVWATVPPGHTSLSYAEAALEHGVYLTPGTGYGPGGEGYVRLALTCDEERLDRALERLARLG